MRVKDRGITGPCFFCGEEYDRGGDWYAHSGVIHLCGKDECVDQVFSLILDSIHPSGLSSQRAHSTLDHLKNRFTSEFWRKMYLWTQR